MRISDWSSDVCSSDLPFACQHAGRLTVLPYGCLGCQCRKCVAAEPIDDPLALHFGTETLIEADRRLVPIEHRPFETATAARDADLRELREQPLADALAALCRLHEQVFEVQARLDRKSTRLNSSH